MNPRTRWHVSKHPATAPAQVYTDAQAPSALAAAERWARSFDPFRHPQDDAPKDVVHANVLDLSTGRRITARISRAGTYTCEIIDADTAASADDVEDASFDDTRVRALARALVPEPRTSK